MNDETISTLKIALEHSPDNIPLRLHLAEALFDLYRLNEAQAQYESALKYGENNDAKLGLAKVSYAQENYTKCNVILESLLENNHDTFDVLLLHTKALVKENALAEAIEIYKKVLALDPSFTNEELDKKLRLGQVTTNDLEEEISEELNQFIQKPDITFKDVGGMDQIKKEIDLKIVQPLLHPEIYEAYGKKIGGGILLYGPPGCGKTYIAKATAGHVNAKFISVSLNDILDMWIGSSEKNLHEIFELARANTPCVLFFDEIDALGASRSDMKQSSGRHLINQFLQELDGIENNNDGVLVLGATNAPWHLDTAFRRPGRFDRIIFVPPPDEDARASIIKLNLQNKPTDSIAHTDIAKKTKDFSGADIAALIDIAIEAKLEDAIKHGVPKPLVTKDLLRAAKKHHPTTKEWFTSAKNFALYANQSGLYDDILDFLKLKK